jgi:hypothetical protein
MTTTYCTDADVLKRNAFAERFCTDTDVVGTPPVKTFERFRLLARDEIDAELAAREPPITGVDCNQLRDVEVLLVLAHGFRESASSAGETDLFLSNAKAYDEKAKEKLEAYRGASDDDDPGSIGGSIPFFRA